jgi:hypothetical protein
LPVTNKATALCDTSEGLIFRLLLQRMALEWRILSLIQLPSNTFFIFRFEGGQNIIRILSKMKQILKIVSGLTIVDLTLYLH